MFAKLAALLVSCDLLFLASVYQQGGPTGIVTYVGIDSLTLVGPPIGLASAFENGSWRPALRETEFRTYGMSGDPRALQVITLAPRSTYGHFIASIRDLKRRNVCNVLVLEGGRRLKSGGIDMENPALVLCGWSIGDAGFYGTLPPDGPLRR